MEGPPLELQGPLLGRSLSVTGPSPLRGDGASTKTQDPSAFRTEAWSCLARLAARSKPPLIDMVMPKFGPSRSYVPVRSAFCAISSMTLLRSSFLIGL